MGVQGHTVVGARAGAAMLALAGLLVTLEFVAALPVRVTNVNTASLPEGEIVVVTYNMLHGFASRTNDSTLEERLEILARELAERAPDVVLLQEASVTGRHGNVVDRLRDAVNTSLAPRGVSYNSALALNHGSFLIGFHEGSAVLARAEILDASALVYRAQSLLPPERRIALEVWIRSEVGALLVVGTHLTSREERSRGLTKRELQARELATRILSVRGAERCIVIAGDFNSRPGSGAVQAMLRSGASDVWASARPGEAGSTSLRGPVTDAGSRPDGRIDFLFVVGVSVRAAEPFLDAPGLTSDGGLLWASDHVGVLGVLALAARQ